MHGESAADARRIRHFHIASSPATTSIAISGSDRVLGPLDRVCIRLLASSPSYTDFTHVSHGDAHGRERYEIAAPVTAYEESAHTFCFLWPTRFHEARLTNL